MRLSRRRVGDDPRDQIIQSSDEALIRLYTRERLITFNMRLRLYISLLLLYVIAAAAFTIPMNVLRKKKKTNQFHLRKLAHRSHSLSHPS
ncbi:hypothetical protein PUN28_013745 [Cardiocondyla obscurior]|uniref:Uncharacterized protein n=1 Tax=Cardiocondyla obscurior TaxID=286306 RepID=A0AAW2F2S3_9HYME